jgi:hypothetical protein
MRESVIFLLHKAKAVFARHAPPPSPDALKIPDNDERNKYAK